MQTGWATIKKDPGRIDFDPYPWHSMAIWILTQMKRWGHLKGDVNYKSVAEQVYRAAGLRPDREGTRISDASGDDGQARDHGQGIRSQQRRCLCEEFQNSQHGLRGDGIDERRWC